MFKRNIRHSKSCESTLKLLIHFQSYTAKFKGGGPKYLIMALFNDRLGTRLVCGNGVLVIGLVHFPDCSHAVIDERSYVNPSMRMEDDNLMFPGSNHPTHFWPNYGGL